jgi:hypothetical protein
VSDAAGRKGLGSVMFGDQAGLAKAREVLTMCSRLLAEENNSVGTARLDNVIWFYLDG